MTINDTLRNLQNETAAQQARDAEARRAASVYSRNPTNIMGKHDFLMLLVAQLRHQNPMEPQNDNEFASQLANFAQLEQLENLNNSMQAMALQQSFSLVGNVVMLDDGETILTGIVEGIFVRDGEPNVVVNGYVFPISSIITVLDSGEIITPRVLIEVSNSLVGRNVKAEYYREQTTINSNGQPEITRVLFSTEGVVTRVFVDDGQLFAHIDDGSANGVSVPVGAIFDIGKPVVPITGAMETIVNNFIIKPDAVAKEDEAKEEEMYVNNGKGNGYGDYDTNGEGKNGGNYGNGGNYAYTPPTNKYPPGYQYAASGYSPYGNGSSYDELT